MGSLGLFFQIICLWGVISANSTETDFNEGIYQLTSEIIGDYLLEYMCMTYAADDTSNAQSLGNVIPMIVIRLGESFDDTLLVETYEQGCAGYIVQTKAENRVKMVRKLKDAKRKAVGHRYNKERYLFLAMSDDDTNADFLLDDCMYFLPNLIFVSRDAISGRFVISNTAVFDPSKKGVIDVLDTWTPSSGFERNANLYWDKTLDVKGRTMLFSMMHYIPYSVVKHKSNKTLFDGIEYRLGKMYMKIINGTIANLDHPKHLWGEVFDNGTGNGILGSVLSRYSSRGESDFGYSAVYQWYCDIVDCTYPHIQAEAICLVPRPRILGSWETLRLPFTTSTWMGISVAYFISSCFVFIIRLVIKYSNDVKISGQLGSTAFRSAFDIFRLHLLQVPRTAHRNDPISTHIKISLICYVFLTILWQGGIASLLTVPRYEKPIDSPAELVAQWPKMEWGSNHKVWVYGIENTIDPVLDKLVQKYRVLDEEALFRRSRTRDFAYFLERLPNKHFGFHHHISEQTVPYLRTMKHHVYTASAVMVLPRGSPFTEKFDHMTHWLYATGVIQKLEIQVSIDSINNHLQTMLLFSDEKEGIQSILTVERILGAFYIYFGGIAVSTLAFIAEKLLGMKKCIKFNRTKIKRILRQK